MPAMAAPCCMCKLTWLDTKHNSAWHIQFPFKHAVYLTSTSFISKGPHQNIPGWCWTFISGMSLSNGVRKELREIRNLVVGIFQDKDKLKHHGRSVIKVQLNCAKTMSIASAIKALAPYIIDKWNLAIFCYTTFSSFSGSAKHQVSHNNNFWLLLELCFMHLGRMTLQCNVWGS